MARANVEFDLVRFGYVLRHRLDELGLSYRQFSAVSGCSVRQISCAVNGMAVDAAACFMLAECAGIDLADMLADPAVAERLAKVRAMRSEAERIANDNENCRYINGLHQVFPVKPAKGVPHGA